MSKYRGFWGLAGAFLPHSRGLPLHLRDGWFTGSARADRWGCVASRGQFRGQVHNSFMHHEKFREKKKLNKSDILRQDESVHSGPSDCPLKPGKWLRMKINGLSGQISGCIAVPGCSSAADLSAVPAPALRCGSDSGPSFRPAVGLRGLHYQVPDC